MKDKLTVPFLKHQLRQATWLPFCLATLVILCVVAYVLQGQEREKIQSIHDSLSELVSSHETFFSQEVYLNQGEALRRRIEDVLGVWRTKYPTVKACLRLEHPDGRINLIERCTTEEAGKAPAESPSYFADKRIQVGSQTLATLRFAVVRRASFFDLFPPVLLITIFVGLIGAALAHRSLVSRVETRLLNPLLAKMREDHKNAAVAEATQMIAHDVRKPFQMLRFALHTLIASKNESVSRIGTQISGDIDASIRSVNAMLNDIIDIGKDVRPALGPISPREIASTAVASIMRTHPESQVTVAQDFTHSHMARGDREQILRVLSNLIENALHATGPTGNIRIKVEEAGNGKTNRIAFSVWNSGATISSDAREKIFTPYFTTKKAGTGLGLAIVKKLVTAHGGRVSCESNEEGTTFSFELEADSSFMDGRAEIGTSTSPLVGLKERNVLVFDDERAVHTIWRHYAEEHGYQTFHHFENWEHFLAQEGHSLVKDAVAFVDLRFDNSRYNGLDIARYLRKLGIRKILAMTSDQAKAAESGLFDGVFGKELPSNLDALVG